MYLVYKNEKKRKKYVVEKKIYIFKLSVDKSSQKIRFLKNNKNQNDKYGKLSLQLE